MDKDSTVIVEGAGNPEAISHRVAVIKSQIRATTADSTVKRLSRTLGKIVRWCLRSSGRSSNWRRLKEMKLHIEDALNATRAAVEESLLVVVLLST